MKIRLTKELLCQEAAYFANVESEHDESFLYGLTDGKAIGNFFKSKFQTYLEEKYIFERGKVARDIDFPGIKVDVRVTNIKNPKFACPYRSPRQKIYGLGYSLLVFVYNKTDNFETRTGRINILHTVFIDAHRTADFQTTSRIQKILENDGNIDDLLALFESILLPVDEIIANQLAEEILSNPPEIGYLTVSSSFQWYLQYSRVIDKAGEVEGILRVS